MLASILAAAALALAAGNGSSSAWRVEVATNGGLSGRGAGGVKIRSSGEVEVITSAGKRCQVKLERAAVAKVGRAVERSRPGRWRPRYFLPDNPTGCCDQVATTLAVVRLHESAEKQIVTGWFDESRQLVPPDAMRVYEAAMDVALAHQGCVATAQ